MGQGDDTFPGFLEPDEEETAVELAETREWRRRLFDAGLAWITGPSRYGGRDLSGAYQKAFDAVARRYAVPGNGLLRVGLGMVAPTVLAQGSDEIRDAYRRAAAGRHHRLPALQRTRRRFRPRCSGDPGQRRVAGQRPASGPRLPDVGLLLCRTAEGPRHGNLTMFLFDMHAPGVEVRPLVQMNGAAFFNEVFLDDVHVPDNHRLGRVGTVGRWP